jgi:hypothetical protein
MHTYIKQLKRVPFHELITGKKKNTDLCTIFAGIARMYGQFATMVHNDNENSTTDYGCLYAHSYTRIDLAAFTEGYRFERNCRRGINHATFHVEEPVTYTDKEYNLTVIEIPIKYQGSRLDAREDDIRVLCFPFIARADMPGEKVKDKKDIYAWWLKNI